jgi:hypothetical protein
VSKLSFCVNYTKTKVNPPSVAIEYEKLFLSMDEALDFCGKLTELGGEVLYVLQLLRGIEDGVLEGEALDRAIRRHRHAA